MKFINTLCILFLNCSLVSAEVLYVYDPWPPFTYEKDGKFEKGIMVDYLNKLFDGISSVDTMSVKWSTVLKLLEKGRADITGPLYKNKRREKYLVFTNALFVENYTLCYLKSQQNNQFTKVEKVEDLYNHRIGIVDGYYYGEELSDHIHKDHIKFKVAKYALTNLRLILRERVDAAIFNETVIKNILLTQEGVHSKVTCSFIPIAPQQFYMGISKSSKVLENLDLINNRILEFRSRNIFKRLRDKYSFDKK